MARRRANDREVAYFTASQLATILRVPPRWARLDPENLSALLGCPPEVRQATLGHSTALALVWPASAIPRAIQTLRALLAKGEYPFRTTPQRRARDLASRQTSTSTIPPSL